MAVTQHFQLLLLKVVAAVAHGIIVVLALLEQQQQDVLAPLAVADQTLATVLIVEHAVLADLEQPAKDIQAAPVCVLM
jgi:hypothetical protein